MVTGAKNENSNVPCESHTLIYLLGLRLIPEASTVGWVAVDELGTVILPAPPPPNPPNPPFSSPMVSAPSLLMHFPALPDALSVMVPAKRYILPSLESA